MGKPGTVTRLLTLFVAASFTVLVAFSLPKLLDAILPVGSSPNRLMLGVPISSIFFWYWIFYACTAFFPACLLTMWRFVGNNDAESTGGSELRSFPNVTVVIPAYNEEDSIGKSIEGIMKQDYKGDIETIVINDGSTDGTARTASRYPVTLVNLAKNRGKGNALNVGVSKSSGAILVFTDSDSVLEKNSVRLLVEYLARNGNAGAVAGFVRVREGNGKLLTHFQAIEYETGQQLDKVLQGESQSVIICPGPLFAAKRDVALRTPFNEASVTEDADFTARVHRSGMGVGFESQAVAYTNAPISVKAWVAQRKRWWAGFLEMWKTHKPWSSANLWMINSYSSYVVSTASLAMLALIPFLMLYAGNPIAATEDALVFSLGPVFFFVLFTAPFFTKRKTLLLLLPLCGTVYFLMKAAVLAGLYVRYALNLGVSVTFGSRIIQVNW